MLPTDAKPTVARWTLPPKVKSFFAALTEDDGWTPQTNRKAEIIYGVLSTGMNNLNLSWYLNHSDDSNIGFRDASIRYISKRPHDMIEELQLEVQEIH
ncbi:unnamed protein product [Durusdinium trenchii]|uniref:Uncharacterized protein n=1 Tax=Durusdinium trenchii TaxID=1381693 RepID=A0ABP0J0T3_9DINO